MKSSTLLENVLINQMLITAMQVRQRYFGTLTLTECYLSATASFLMCSYPRIQIRNISCKRILCSSQMGSSRTIKELQWAQKSRGQLPKGSEQTPKVKGLCNTNDRFVQCLYDAKQTRGFWGKWKDAQSIQR